MTNPYLAALKTAYEDLEKTIAHFEATIAERDATIEQLQARVKTLEEGIDAAAATAAAAAACWQTPPPPLTIPTAAPTPAPTLLRWTEAAPMILSTQTMSLLVDDQQRERARLAFEAMKEPAPKSPPAARPPPSQHHRVPTASWAERLRQTLPA